MNCRMVRILSAEVRENAPEAEDTVGLRGLRRLVEAMLEVDRVRAVPEYKAYV